MENENQIENGTVFGELVDPMVNIEDYMNNLAHVGVIQQEAVQGICQIIQGEINTLRADIVNKLVEKIDEWEDKEIDAEKGGALYSLALRRAVDIVMAGNSLASVEEAELAEAGILPVPEDTNEPPDEDG